MLLIINIISYLWVLFEVFTSEYMWIISLANYFYLFDLLIISFLVLITF